MKEINELIGQVNTLHESCMYNFIIYVAGYPLCSIEQSYDPIIRYIENGLLTLLKSEGFEEDHFSTKFLLQIVRNYQELNKLDILAGKWVLERSRNTQKGLFEKCRKEIYRGDLTEIIQKEIFLPEWIDDIAYQLFLDEAIPHMKSINGDIKNLEELSFSQHRKNEMEGFIINEDWKIRQNIRFLDLILEKGLRKSITEIKLIKQNEINPKEWMNKGFSQRVSDMIDRSETLSPMKSIKLLQKAIYFSPPLVQLCTLYYLLAMKFEDIEEWDKAIDAYSQMLTVAPPNGIGLFYRAKILLKLNRFSEAKSDLETALLLPPNHVYILNEEQKNEIRTLLQKK